MECERFLDAVANSTRPVILPTLVGPEVAGAVRRASQNAELAATVAGQLDALPGVVFVPLDQTLANEAMGIVAKAGLRGGDAVYVATARRFDAILVTLDTQQRDRVPDDVTAWSPAEFLNHAPFEDSAGIWRQGDALEHQRQLREDRE
jgi:predicted nucleic acid-binding protein